MPSPPPRSFAARVAARFVFLLGLVAWPAFWLLSAWLHLRLSGIGLAAFTCDEPITDFVVHQCLVTLGPWFSVALLACAAELDERR